MVLVTLALLEFTVAHTSMAMMVMGKLYDTKMAPLQPGSKFPSSVNFENTKTETDNTKSAGTPYDYDASKQ